MQNGRKVLSRERLLELTHSESLEVFDRTIDVLIGALTQKNRDKPASTGINPYHSRCGLCFFS